MTEDELDAMLITARRQACELIGTQVEESAEAAVAGLLVDLGILQDRLDKLTHLPAVCAPWCVICDERRWRHGDLPVARDMLARAADRIEQLLDERRDEHDREQDRHGELAAHVPNVNEQPVGASHATRRYTTQIDGSGVIS